MRLQKYILLDALTKTPNVICTTAIITDIFIFKEFMNTRLFSATAQTGSIPIGYIHYPYLGMGPPSATPDTSKHEPNRSKLIDRKSLYINPQYIAKKPIRVSMYLCGLIILNTIF